MDYKEKLDKAYSLILDVFLDLEKQDLASDSEKCYFYVNLDNTLDTIANCKQSLRLFPEFNPVNRKSITDEA